MTSRRRLFVSILFAALPFMGNCGSSATDSPAVPTTPTSTATVTEPFTGTLNRNSGVTFPFLATTAGSVAAVIKSTSPDATIAIGIWLGSWSGSACSWAVANDNAQQGTAVTGTTTATANHCVRVYDVGQVGDTPITFAIDVTHP